MQKLFNREKSNAEASTELSPQNVFKPSSEMNIFEKPFFRFSVVMLTVVGQWPYQDRKFRSICRFIVVILYMSFLEVQIMKLVTSKYNVDLLVEFFPYFLATVAIGIKYFTCWIQIEAITGLLERIKYDWYLSKNEEEFNILRSFAEEATIYGILYICFVYLGLIIFMAVPFIPRFLDIILPLNESRVSSFPLEVEYLFAKDKYFYAILVHMDLSVFVILSTLIASDMLCISIVIHASGTFSILGYRLEHLFDCSKQNYYVDLKSLVRIRINECIKYHDNILDYLEMVKSCYYISIVIQLVFGIATVTVVLLRVFHNLVVRHSYGQAIISGLHAIGHMLAIFMCILPAQRLIDSSSEAFYKVYFSHWYNAPARTQKSVILIMQRTKEPCCLTTAGIITASFELFATMVQMSLSYFTVLYSVR